MSKEDKFNLTGTTKKRITKKTMPEAPKTEKKETVSTPKAEKKKTASVKLKKTNIEVSEELHFKAKMTAMELGITMREYIKSLIISDLKKRNKI